MSFEGFISFRKMITPAFMTIFYILGAIVITLYSFGNMVLGGTLAAIPFVGSGTEAVLVIVGLVVLVLGNILWRVFCEYLVVQFRIYDELVSINAKTGSGSAFQASSVARMSSTQTKFCQNCGAELHTNARFCPKCGQAVI